MEEKLRSVARWVRESHNIVIFTGAGISTESGIPDFRSPGGIWDRYDPAEFTYQHFLASSKNRMEQWKMFREMRQVITSAVPNPAHLAGAELEKRGKLNAIITQNVDGLHQKAGNSLEKVIELHGTMEEIECLKCKKRIGIEYMLEKLREKNEEHRCEVCEGVLKPAAVFFGEAMPHFEMERAHRSVAECDLCFSIGSSLAVYPAAHFPVMAKQRGARLVIINREPTHADQIADAVIHGSAGEIMQKLLQFTDEKD